MVNNSLENNRVPALAVVVDWCVVMGGDDGNMCTIRQVKNHLKRALFNTVTCSKATASCNAVVLHITPITPLLFVEHRYAVLTHTLRRLYVAVVVFSVKKIKGAVKKGLGCGAIMRYPCSLLQSSGAMSN